MPGKGHVVKNFVIGLLVAAALLCGKRIYDWRQYQNDTAYRGQLSFEYLNEPVLRLEDGTTLTRAQVFDLLIVNAAKAK